MKEKEYCITQSMHETSQQIFSNNDKAIDKLLQMIPIEKKEEAMKLIKQFKSSEETESMQLIEYLIDEIEKNNLNISGKLDLQTELQQLQKIFFHDFFICQGIDKILEINILTELSQLITHLVSSICAYDDKDLSMKSIIHLLHQLPTIRETLKTDLLAAYAGDPAAPAEPSGTYL